MIFNFIKQKISVQVYKYKLECSILALFVILSSASIMLHLCIWQFQKGLYKQNMLDNHRTKQNFSEVIHNIDKLNFSKVSVKTITCYGNKLLLVDLQQHNNSLGYHVILPCKLSTNHNLLINLGWIKNIAETKNYQKKFNNIEFTGYLKKAQHNPFINQLPTPNIFPKIIQGFEIDYINQSLNKKFLPAVLLLEEKQPIGFIKEWSIQQISWQRHYFYALQWLAFCIISLIMFIYINTTRINHE